MKTIRIFAAAALLAVQAFSVSASDSDIIPFRDHIDYCECECPDLGRPRSFKGIDIEPMIVPGFECTRVCRPCPIIVGPKFGIEWSFDLLNKQSSGLKFSQ